MSQSARIERALMATLVIAAVAVGFAYASSEWSFKRHLSMARMSGWVAFLGLTCGLSLTPLSGFSKLRALPVWRRAIGIGTALAAVIHVSLSLFGPLDGAWSAVFTWPYLLAGALAFAVLLLLLLTSFPRIVRAFRVRHWKVLHRLVYAAALFAITHLLLSPWGDVMFKGAASAVLLALLFYRLRALPQRGVTRRNL